MPSIRARGWGWRHPGRRAWALRGVDLDVADGERVLLLGPSGAGKSTLLAGIAGLLDAGPDTGGDAEGELLVDGVPAGQARVRAVEAGRGVAPTGLLLQDPQAQTVLARCGDDVAFGLENYGVPREEIWPRVRRALDDVGLGVALDRPTARLSGGQRQRLALAGVLALRPGVLLLDEPTAMLDPDGAAGLRRVVADQLAATGATAVVVEHRVQEWLDVVDRVVVLEPGGGVVADGPAARVLAEHGERLAAAGVWVPGRHPLRLGPAGATGPAGPAGPAGAAGPACPPAASGAVSGPVLLRTEGLAVHRRGLPEPVLTDVDLTLRAGRGAALVGPNGSGKSTLALALGGLVRPGAGRVRAEPPLADGAAEEPYRWRPRELVARIGSVFQDPRHQLVAATVTEELAVGPRRLRLPEDVVRARVDELLERLRLTHLARANPFTLSGGEQRRLSVATALATRPRLLVLDEPTFGQDARTWAELVGLLGDLLARGTGLVTATHDEELVAALAGDVWRVGAGVVRSQVPAATAAAR